MLDDENGNREGRLNTSLRTAGVGDAARLVNLQERARDAGWSEDGWRRELNRRQSTVWVVERQSDRLIAALAMWRVLDELQIVEIVVDPAYRRQGIGAELLNTAIAVAQTRTIRTVVLEVRENNEPALALYRTLGFECVQRRAGYYDDGHRTALIMKRHIDAGRGG